MRHKIVVEFRSIIIIVDHGPIGMRPTRKGDTNHSFDHESVKLCDSTRFIARNQN